MKYLLSLMLLILCSATNAQIISSVAGNGTFGFSGDGGSASAAMINRPSGIAIASNGDIYFADGSNNRIRKVTLATSIISTVAGNGTAVYAGDGGLGTSASIARPSGIALDAAGNIYIADADNNRIRKVTVATGQISTVAGNGAAAFAGDGGQAIAASISGPSGVMVDASNNIYICDRGNGRIRKVQVSNGTISTFAGTGATSPSGDGGQASLASFGELGNLTKDALGNLIIVERFRIRKITIATGIITTVAGGGTGTPANDGDGALATSAIMAPNGVAVDALGNIYISDGNNNRIRKVSVADGKINPFAGGGSTVGLHDGSVATTVQFEPGDIAIDNSSSIYFGDNLYNRIRKITNPVVPVVLGYFKINGTTEGAVTSWQTLSELNTAHFVLEASSDGMNFKAVTSFQSSGNSSIPKEYTYTDKTVYVSPRVYYRLRIVDKDGSVAYSKTETLDKAVRNKISVYPNPAVSTIYITGDFKRVDLIDAYGRVTNSINSSGLTIDVSRFPNGNYTLRCVGHDGLTSYLIITIAH